MKSTEQNGKGKKNLSDKIFIFVQIVLILVMLVLIWKIGSYWVDDIRSRRFSQELQKAVITQETEKPVPIMTEQSEESDGTAPQADEPEKQTDMIVPKYVDFDILQASYPDTTAWLLDPGGTINYVVAQAEDNDYYLHRLLDGRTASGGTLFMDYRNSADFSDWNTMIYGHNMKNGTMFASLMKYQEPGYYEEHPNLYLYTPGHRYRMELVAGYITSVTDKVYEIPATKVDRDTILEHAFRSSSFISGITIGEEDKLVTLSTCSYAYDDARYVVIGRLVED